MTRTLKTAVLFLLLAAILVAPCAASAQVNADTTPRFCHPVDPVAAAELKYVPQVFDLDKYCFDKSMLITPQVECFNRLHQRGFPLERVTPKDQFAIEVSSGGSAEVQEDHRVLASPGVGWITILLRVVGKPQLVWWDTCLVVVKAAEVTQDPLVVPRVCLDDKSPVYIELEKSIIEWRTPDYGDVPRRYDVNAAMRDAFDGGIKGSVSLDFLATLSQGVDKLSNGRYLVYEPTHDEYVKLGGITCRCMQVAYLARRDNVTGEKRPFALHTEGDTDLFGHWAN